MALPRSDLFTLPRRVFMASLLPAGGFRLLVLDGGGRGDDSLDSISRLYSSGRGAQALWQPSESRVVIGLLCDAAFVKGMKF